MQISSRFPDNYVDGAGVVIASGGVRAVATTPWLFGFAAGNPSAGAGIEDGFLAFGPDGVQQSGAAASWENLAPAPANAVIIFSDGLLSICTPDDASAAGLRVWASWETYEPPVTDAPAVLFPWVRTVARGRIRGLLPAPAGTQALDRVSVCAGSVWVQTSVATVCLDLATDLATLYRDDDGCVYTGGLYPSIAIPDDPWTGTADASLALGIPSSQRSALATWEGRSAAWAAIGGGDLSGGTPGSGVVTLLQRPHSSGRMPFKPAESVPLGHLVFDLMFLPDGRLLASVYQSDGDATSSRVELWLRGSVDDPAVTGLAAWTRVATTPTRCTPPCVLAFDGRWIWLTATADTDELGTFVFRLSTPAVELSAGQTAELEAWAGPRWPRVPGAFDSKFANIDYAQFPVSLSFCRGLPCLVTALQPDVGGGVLLTVFDRGFRTPLWRRWYRDTDWPLAAAARSMSSSLLALGSREVIPGFTGSPVAGYGPDDTVEG